MCDSCDAADEAWLELVDRYHGEIDTGERISLAAKIRNADAERKRVREWNHGGPRDDETAEGFRMELRE